MTTRAELLDALLQAILDRASEAEEEDGGLDEDTQAEVEALADLARPGALEALLAEEGERGEE